MVTYDKLSRLKWFFKTKSRKFLKKHQKTKLDEYNYEHILPIEKEPEGANNRTFSNYITAKNLDIGICIYIYITYQLNVYSD